jgi:hypothetical protein
MLRIISLGAGVQSSAMFLMACRGELGPKPDAAIFADTQWEPREVYAWLGQLEAIGAAADIPIIRATKGSVRDDALRSQVRGRVKDGVRWASMPLHTLSPEGSKGIIRRQCTEEYKLNVIEREERRLLGLKPKQRAPRASVEQWLGISADEAGRMRDSRNHWQTLRYPLIYDCEPPMTRADCKAWLGRNGFAVPRKSACLGCPFHSDSEWREIKKNPDEWRDVVEFDEAIRDCGGMRGKVYLHRSCRPLSEVDLSSAEDHGQLNWINECEGMCGV